MPYGPIQNRSLFDPSLLLGIPMCRPALSNYSPLPAETAVGGRGACLPILCSPVQLPWGWPHGYPMGPAPWLLHGASPMATPWGQYLGPMGKPWGWLSDYKGSQCSGPMATPWGQYLDPMEKTMGMVPCRPWGRLTGCECESTIVKHVSGAEGKNPS